MKILIVEDNAMSGDVLSRRLVKRGHEVHLAKDGAEGVDMARALMPELILMDISLPVMDGLEATRRLKAAPDTAVIPILALTAHAMAGDEARCREVGADDYDTKPVDLQRLLGKMDGLMEKRRARSA
ncbi:MAG: response regulator [Polyangiaceae bacterium]|nr:response regulator [Polyangiaceae bacterium]